MANSKRPRRDSLDLSDPKVFKDYVLGLSDITVITDFYDGLAAWQIPLKNVSNFVKEVKSLDCNMYVDFLHDQIPTGVSLIDEYKDHFTLLEPSDAGLFTHPLLKYVAFVPLKHEQAWMSILKDIKTGTLIDFFLDPRLETIDGILSETFGEHGKYLLSAMWFRDNIILLSNVEYVKIE